MWGKLRGRCWRGAGVLELYVFYDCRTDSLDHFGFNSNHNALASRYESFFHPYLHHIYRSIEVVFNSELQCEFKTRFTCPFKLPIIQLRKFREDDAQLARRCSLHLFSYELVVMTDFPTSSAPTFGTCSHVSGSRFGSSRDFVSWNECHSLRLRI
jgi:hypothetical protein